MGTFEELWSQQSNAGPKERGDRFEELSKWFLENDPVYKRLFSAVYRWREWPNRWSDADNGIDLIAEGRNGHVWAIQCKGYGESSAITKADINSFIAESTRPAINNLLLMATKESIGSKVRRLLEETQKPAEWLLAEAFRSRELEWPDNFSSLRPASQKRKIPRPHQIEAAEAIAQGLNDADRGQAIMACGTGKTFTSILVAEELKAKRILVLVPSIWLVSQTLSEWAASWQGNFRFLAVCSDQKAGDGSMTSVNHEELGIPSTTDVVEIEKWISDSGSEPSVIFSTYQSSASVREAAQRVKSFSFDLAIADEAHRTATKGNSPFSEIHEGLRPLCSKTLFMTATPRILGKTVAKELKARGYPNYSMDNSEQFGEVVFELPFSAAIELDLLVDYQAMATVVSDEQVRELMENRALVETDSGDDLEADELVAMIGLARRIHEQGLRRIITFHSRVARAERFAKYFSRTAQWAFPHSEALRGIQHYAVSAKIMGGERRRRISILANSQSKSAALISNARVLTEGVDIPSVDAVAFVDPKNSVVDIVQAIGRVLRKSPGKKFGEVIVVGALSETEPIDEQLDNDARLKPIWNVIKALRAHDERLGDWLDSARTQIGRRRIARPGGVAIKIDIPWKISNEVSEKIQLHAIEQTTESWHYMFGLLGAYVEQHGTSLVPQKTKVESGEHLGGWVAKQRGRYREGSLLADRVTLLESFADWNWDPLFAEFSRKVGIVARYYQERRTTQISSSDRFFEEIDVQAFVTHLRRQWRKGRLTQAQIDLLERTPGWVWEPKHEVDQGFARPAFIKAVEAYRVFLAENPGQEPPWGLRIGESPLLRDFAGRVRREYQDGSLTEAEIRLMESLPGWSWDPSALRESEVRTGFEDSALRESQVRTGFEDKASLIAKYFEFEGTASLPNEKFEGQDLRKIGGNIRKWYKQGTLNEAEIERMEAIPGWTWFPKKGPKEESLRSFIEKADLVDQHIAAYGKPPSKRGADRALGEWLVTSRAKYRKGLLSAEKVAVIQGRPGWGTPPLKP